MSKRLTDERLGPVMLAAGFTPLEPYPGVTHVAGVSSPNLPGARRRLV
jgi:hypothetical protein